MNAPPELIADTVGEVLEQQAFAFAEPSPCAALELHEDSFLHATIAFDGPRQGRLEAAVPLSLGVELAANVLGVDAKDAQAQDMAADAVGELLNVICGQVLTALHGTGAVFQLEIPSARVSDAAAWQTLPFDDDCVGFLIDDEYPAVFRLRQEGPEA